MLRIGLLLAAFSSPTLALAQSPFAPHGYVGLGASVLNQTVFVSTSSATPAYIYHTTYTTTGGPVLTVGYQFSPRLAVQLTPAVQWGRQTDVYSPYQAVGGPQNRVVIDYTRITQLTVPLLLRYTFTNPANRLRFAALAGAAWFHPSDHRTSTLTESTSGAALAENEFSSSDNKALLTLGLGVGYSLSERLALAVDLPVHYIVGALYYYEPTFGQHLLFQPQLSAHYALGSR